MHRTLGPSNLRAPLLLAGGLAILLAGILIGRLAVSGVLAGAAVIMLTLAVVLAYNFLRRDAGGGQGRPTGLQPGADKRPLEEIQMHSPGADYQDIFDNNPMPMWIFDLETLRFLAVNEAATAHYGYSRSEFLAMTIRDIRREADLGSLQRYMTTPRPALANSGGWKHLKKDGTIIDVEITSHELLWRGRKARLVASNDVTERLRTEARIMEMNVNLEAMVRERTQQLESVNHELETFSYSVSHDLRAPLRVIDGFSQALLEDYAGRFDEKGSKYLNRIRVATQKMGSLIDDLLNLARVSRRSVKRAPTDLSGLAREVLRELRERDPGRQVTVEIEPGIQVDADAGLLKIVLTNLIGNAWKFTAKAPAPHISVGRVMHEGANAVYVRDNGAGFDMRYVDKLFGAFQRLHGESEFDGSGIGLATVQRIVNLHGGRVWAEGKLDAGATFYFTLDSGGSHG